MTVPPIRWEDLVALGMNRDASVVFDGGAISTVPPQGWLVSRVLMAAMSSQAPENASDYCRHVRDLVLAATDWTQSADSPLHEADRAAWATYRQALRDVPANYSGDGPILWPAMPDA